MAPRRPLVDALFNELKARQQQDDAGVPVRKDRHYYQWRFEPGGEYRICRVGRPKALPPRPGRPPTPK